MIKPHYSFFFMLLINYFFTFYYAYLYHLLYYVTTSYQEFIVTMYSEKYIYPKLKLFLLNYPQFIIYRNILKMSLMLNCLFLGETSFENIFSITMPDTITVDNTGVPINAFKTVSTLDSLRDISI